MRTVAFVLLTTAAVAISSAQAVRESREVYEARMRWWNEARFGLFIHWGLYAIPAGTWEGKTDYGEWIRESAHIPLATYEKFVKQFNPVRFDADAWVRTAKAAGIRYIVITAKHHDGFCLFDAKETEFDVMSTPFHRDVMRALADACRREGMKICWYYSIMDWHHPDYLPRRGWETDRPADGADFSRYIRYMKEELRELVTNYGDIGVLWFDGEWESTWNTAEGRDLYEFVRQLQPSIIINNRVGAGRSGMEGFSENTDAAGDFGTPEQQIPATGIPGVYWETCMTMNDHWGYNSHDRNWKSSHDLIRMLADIASKGGNFLLNVGPTAEGVFPDSSVDRLRGIGRWMAVNGDAIHGTSASPFVSIPWGRCTVKRTPGGETLYLHVFEWPSDGRLMLNGVSNAPERAYVLSDASQRLLPVSRAEDALSINVPVVTPDPNDAVVVLEFRGPADVSNPPVITAPYGFFIDSLDVSARSSRARVEIRYTLDGTVPTERSPRVDGPIRIGESATVSARCFRGITAVSGASRARFRKVSPLAARVGIPVVPGVKYSYYEGIWDSMPQFSSLVPVTEGACAQLDLRVASRPEFFAVQYSACVRIPREGIYTFTVTSDDGSRLLVDDSLVADNDGLHAAQERSGVVALAGGLHAVTIEYFQKTGGKELRLFLEGPGMPRHELRADAFFRTR